MDDYHELIAELMHAADPEPTARALAQSPQAAEDAILFLAAIVKGAVTLTTARGDQTEEDLIGRMLSIGHEAYGWPDPLDEG